MNLVQTML